MVGFASFLLKVSNVSFRLSHRGVSSRIAVLGIGNPLLDFTVFDDHGLIARYGIPRNVNSEIGPAHRRIFEEVLKPPHKPIVVLGGATQNTIRIAQWTLGKEGKTAFYGSIADDALGAAMQQLAAQSAVEVHYKVRQGVRTGASLSFNLQDEAAMVIDYGTASAFKTDAFGADLQPLMTDAAMIYLGAYMWSMSPVTARSIAQFAEERGKPLATDLQSVLFCPYFASRQYDSLRHIDFLFGNAAEALALAQCLARSDFPFANDFAGFLGESAPSSEVLVEIARLIAALPKAGGSPHRRVVFTNGPEPVVFCDGSTGAVETVPTLRMRPGAIKDPRGRGDAFIGGFLAKAAQGSDLMTACAAGMAASSAVLQSIGCNPKAQN